jgi:hypothetical protein
VNTRMKAAFGCHLAAILIVIAFGFTYLFRTEFMPYHAVAVGVPWDQVNLSFQVLILGLMRAVGGACFAVAVLELILLLVPFRQGAVWARWTIPAGGLVMSAAALYAMTYVALHTPATPPWIAPAAGALLLVIGLLLSLGQPSFSLAGSRDGSAARR